MSAGLFDKILNGTEKINTVIFSFDGKKVISISDDNKNIKVWDIATGKCKKLTGHTNEVCTIDVSKDGNYIASGAKDQNIILWDAKTLKYLKKLTGHTSEIRTLSFSLNNPRIASGSADCTIKIWDIDSGNCIMSISNTALVTLIKFLPDENLITSDWGHTINVWDSSTGKPIKTIKSLEKDQHINSICFSSKGKVASGSYGIMIWDKNNHQKSVCVKFLGEHKKIIRSMDFSPDGTKIVSSCGNEMKIWNINSGRRVNKVEHSGRINSVKFSPDSKQIVSGSDDGKINVWRLNFNSIPDYLEE